MSWLIRYLTYAPARQLLRDCAACTVEAFGARAESHLRAEIEPGTPPSGRLLMWLIIREVRKQDRR